MFRGWWMEGAVGQGALFPRRADGAGCEDCEAGRRGCRGSPDAGSSVLPGVPLAVTLYHALQAAACSDIPVALPLLSQTRLIAVAAGLPWCSPPCGVTPTLWCKAHLRQPTWLLGSWRPPPALISVPGLYLPHCHTLNCFPSGNTS